MPASSTIFCCRAPEEQEHADQKPRKLTQVKPAQRSGAPARLDLERQRIPSHHNHATSTHRQSSLRTHLLKTCDGLMALPLQVEEEESRRLRGGATWWLMPGARSKRCRENRPLTRLGRVAERERPGRDVQSSMQDQVALGALALTQSCLSFICCFC